MDDQELTLLVEDIETLVYGTEDEIAAIINQTIGVAYE